MRITLGIIFTVIFILAFNTQAAAQENGEAYYDFGVFSFEDKDYENAEKNFKKALELSPDNPYYNHFLGKTYLETKQYEAAKEYLLKAQGINPDIPDLLFDLADLYYETGDYLSSGELFSEIAKKEPENILAHYYAGINLFKRKKYSQALNFFLKSSQGSPTIKSNGYYYAGVCYQKTGDYDRATEMFEYVRDNAESLILVENAINWLQGIDKLKKQMKPYSLYFKLSRQYDDNVRLEPSDLDIDQGADKSDCAAIAYFSGKYNFVNREKMTAGARYSHYQKWHDDLNEFNLTGSMLDIYTEYRYKSLGFGLSWLPSFYWADSDSYLRRQQLKPRVKWVINNDLSADISLSYFNNNYLDDDNRDGHTNAVNINMNYNFLNNRARLTSSLAYEDNSASHPDYYYGEIKAGVGAIFLIPWDLTFRLDLKYNDKKFDNTDSYYSVKRNDDKFSGSIGLSRSLYYEWLSIEAEFQYTDNDSNIKDYEYTRAETTLSLTARY